MGKNKDPPPFTLDKQYTQWKTEVKAWLFSADTTDKNKAALSIALSLPEKGCNSIRQRIFNSVKFFSPGGTEANPTEEVSKDAWKDLIAFMDKEFAKDDIAELYDKTEAFLHTVKREDDSMKDFINKFDDAFSQATKAGIGNVSSGFIMCLFMKNAGIDQRDFKFVASGIDFTKKDTLYDQAKESMIKYFGSIGSKTESAGASGGVMDMDTLWSRGGGNRGGYRGGYRGGGFRGGFRGGRSSEGGQQEGREVSSRNSGNIFGNPKPLQFRKLNPKKFGKVLKCHNCQAVTHLANECPEANVTLIGEPEDLEDLMKMNIGEDDDGENDDEDDYVGDIAKRIAGKVSTDTHYTNCWSVFAMDDINQVLMQDGEGQKRDNEDEGVLDTGCISTVGPKTWMNQRLKKMSAKSREMVKVAPSGRVFRFGGGTTAKSLGLYTVPMSVAGKNVFLHIDVVEAPIPLLISKAAMKKAGALIDMNEDTIKIFGQTVEMSTVKAGHYAIKLDDYIHDKVDETVEVLEANTEKELTNTMVEVLNVWAEDEETREKQLKKIHDQMGHPSIKVFKKMIQTSDGFNDDINKQINKLYENCVVCIRHGKGKIRPKVCAPMSQEVNSTIAMDLKIWPALNVIILYITCLFSRFTHGTIIPNKKPESVIKAFMDEWVMGFFGTPKHAILVDNGGEFMNAKFKSMCEKLNVKLMSTGANSPWQNGIVERNHGVVDSIIARMKTDNPSASVKSLLRTALFTKNMMTNKDGFSSYQIVTGSQPRIPGVPYNDPPGNEAETSSEAVRKGLSNIFSTRQKYVSVENNERIKKALNSRIPPPKLEFYENGEEVWYRHGKEGIWEGPATVIGQRNKVIYISQGRFLLAASQTNIRKRNPEEEKRVMLAIPTTFREVVSAKRTSFAQVKAVKGYQRMLYTEIKH